MTLEPLRLAVAVALLAPAALAQVDVRLDPVIPVAGQPVRATVTFFGAQPEAVSVFVRPVGGRAYQELVAADAGGGVWSVELPSAAPPQGIEAFARYRQDGADRTTPAQDPENAPFRIPSFVVSAGPAAALPPRQYRMVTVPLTLGAPPGLPIALGSDDALAVFGDDYGEAAAPTDWRLLRWDEATARYRDAAVDGVGPIRAGEGYWLITNGGGLFDAERGLSTGVAVVGTATVPASVDVPIGTGWTQIGSPFLVPVSWDAVERPAGVEDPVAFRARAFLGGQTTLAPWEGYFVFNPGGPATLRFRVGPGDVGSDTRTLAARLRQRAGAGAAALRVTASAGAASDEGVLGLLGDGARGPAPVDLRKPPAVDAGLRLAARDAEADWLGRFRSRADAAWTLTLATPTDATLRLDAVGDWPAGLVVEDLDRGVALDVSAGRVAVPAIADVPVRTLRVRLGDVAAGLDEITPTLGAPRPNPTAGAVAVPFRLPAAARVRLDVVDVLGRVVRVIVDERREAGAHEAAWDGRDGAGRPAAAGVYLLRLDAGAGPEAVRVTRL